MTDEELQQQIDALEEEIADYCLEGTENKVRPKPPPPETDSSNPWVP